MNRFALWLCAAVAVLPAQDARQIVEEAQRRTQASSQRYEGTLTVTSKRGQTAQKRWRYERIGAHGNSKAVLRFTAPAEVKGVALLVVNHPDRASDQWMWTPAIQRERRIALQDRSTRFFGTDFTFEDLEEREAQHYQHQLAGEEAVDGAPCWRIEWRPAKGRSSQYDRSLAWVRKDNYAYARIERFSGEKLVRRLHLRDIRVVQGVPTAHTLEMEDLRRGSRTTLKFESLQYNIFLKDDDFTLQALRRE